MYKIMVYDIDKQINLEFGVCIIFFGVGKVWSRDLRFYVCT